MQRQPDSQLGAASRELQSPPPLLLSCPHLGCPLWFSSRGLAQWTLLPPLLLCTRPSKHPREELAFGGVAKWGGLGVGEGGVGKWGAAGLVRVACLSPQDHGKETQCSLPIHRKLHMPVGVPSGRPPSPPAQPMSQAQPQMLPDGEKGLEGRARPAGFKCHTCHFSGMDTGAGSHQSG